jgi:hypothetical protein
MGSDETVLFTEEEQELAEILLDPVKFAEHHFGWKAYPYQAESLRDTWYRKALRWGRRTGKSDMLAIFVLWYAFTHGKDVSDPDDQTRPAVCLIAAPYENQVKLIFRRIRELIEKSPELKDSLKENTKNPEYIRFKNNSIIAGFTAGSRSGAGAANIRGQFADWIIVDEMDYMTDEDINAIFAIASDQNRPKDLPPIGLMVSSTPTGRRGKFYEMCMDAQDNVLEVRPGRYHGTHRDSIWTEYYYPSQANPGWGEDEEKDKLLHEWRVTLGQDGFVHEILAEFGTETVGVFNKNYIDRAKKAYDYISKPKKDTDNIRVMGVDWDKYQATPTLCILEWCPDEENSYGQRGMFKVINRESILREEFTLDAGVRKIMEWNHHYQPEWIYVDRGYGEYQIETLHKAGKMAGERPKDPAYMLHKRVVGVSFSENREIRDPGISEVVKKPIKPWMVTQTVILFERDRLIINAEDDELWKQLENYRVEKISVHGQPTYTSVNEHGVDSLMLCALAIADKLPDLIRFVQKYDPTRVMALAPAIITPPMSVSRSVTNDINRDDGEKFLTKKMKDQNSQTWYRVNDLRDTIRNKNIDQATLRQFAKSPFAPRGSARRPSARGKF